jgi:hypothetical protein
LSEGTYRYRQVQSGEISCYPQGFWNGPDGIARLAEIIRYKLSEQGMERELPSRTILKEWGLAGGLGVCEDLQLLSRLVRAERPPSYSTLPATWERDAARAKEARESSTRRRVNLTNAVMSAVWSRDQGKCVACGSKEDLEFDHVIPFSKGGSSEAANLRLLCLKCNRSRGARI